MAVKRTRNFACVVYPESAPQNWLEILQDEFVPAFVSPLHDRDINPTGEPKKEHYHIMLMFDGVKTTEQTKEIFTKIGGVGCEVVQSIRGYARYLCHLDNPEKVQYNQGDVKCLCGSDYDSVIGLSSDKYKAITEICHFCRDNEIYYYSDLFDYCTEYRYDWLRVLCDNGTYVVKEYLKTLFWKKENNL